MLRLLLTLQLLLVSHSYPFFRAKIPNGKSVPHPCPTNAKGIWDGVGHQNQNGGGVRNRFGLAFYEAGRSWTEDLCKADSDGDGKSNGAELGDPDCTWKSGSTPPKVASGHPGVCEPVDSSLCLEKNGWNVCGQKEFDCPGIKKADVKRIDLKFEKTPVPATVTNYYCKLFDLPSDQDYHIIADRPLIDNKNVIHHMLLYACPQDVDLSDIEYAHTTPSPCGMLVQSLCTHIIGGWTVGGVGDCFDGIDAGTRLGKTAFQKAILEVHWNNPERSTGWEDGSGMSLWYTKNLKKYDLGVLTVGQVGLKLPPGKSRIEDFSRCSSKCIRDQLNGETLNIVSAGMHMHYLGTEGYLDLYRNDEHVKSLAADQPFRYDSPVDHNHETPVQMHPGDELEAVCVYNTSRQKRHTYYGDATSDEMCFSFITYYPKINFNYCVHFGAEESCNFEDLETVKGCKMDESEEFWDKLTRVNETCDNTGLTCKEECKKLFVGDDVDPCYTGDAQRYMQYWLPLEVLKDYRGDLVLNAFRSCDDEIYMDSISSAVRLGYSNKWLGVLMILACVV